MRSGKGAIQEERRILAAIFIDVPNRIPRNGIRVVERAVCPDALVILRQGDRIEVTARARDCSKIESRRDISPRLRSTEAPLFDAESSRPSSEPFERHANIVDEQNDRAPNIARV